MGPSIDLLDAIASRVQEYMASWDASHDYEHVQRVRRLARRIAAQERARKPTIVYDITLIDMACLLHDADDHKYRPRQSAVADFQRQSVDADHQRLPKPGPNMPVAARILQEVDVEPVLAKAVLAMIPHVSYSAEQRDPTSVAAAIRKYPELAVVQDADRLDALGAVGIGRAFAYGAAKTPEQGLARTIAHFDAKLDKLAALMKTATGKEMAQTRTKRLRVFRGWWEEETT